MSEMEESRVRENLMHGIDEGTLVYNLSSTLPTAEQFNVK